MFPVVQGESVFSGMSQARRRTRLGWVTFTGAVACPCRELDSTSDQFQIFEVVLRKRRRKWLWRVSTTEGDAVIVGSESSRPAAKYNANRALFLLLLSAPYRSIRTLLVLFGITAARQNLAELLFNWQA
jgi:hypothetical protein